MLDAMEMDTIVAVSIGILATIFVGSLVCLIIVCRHKYCRRVDLLSRQHTENRPDVQLVDAMEGNDNNGTDLELDDVRLTHPNIEEILQDDIWVNDATGLVPHCIAILKTCHLLTDKLVAMTMRNGGSMRSPETLTDIVAIAKRISPRVDAVVRCMYPPLDPRLLEARCTALVLSVTHLVLLTKNGCRMTGVLDWIEQSLAEVEEHLQVLREASHQCDTTRAPSNSDTSGDSQEPLNNPRMHQSGPGPDVASVAQNLQQQQQQVQQQQNQQQQQHHQVPSQQQPQQNESSSVL
ncbi:transmembrane protein 98-like [Lingula anatina]|uniref:Transmembrane protein 98 n=1 Tax=Lingula anatina TaxID=7574 RepID=A0A1S3IPD0_LINAN|nr:transmembrane protein 98-like [Lingula anatina]XP_013399934.1 transmembrane protein 98-like [Lingula anatina]XP_013399935.1 transmembrane protein 98-like [Lingula anatina]|eukprot:XP_013399933.1 transmembrane protein 98-like [Lingula anatina]